MPIIQTKTIEVSTDIQDKVAELPQVFHDFYQTWHEFVEWYRSIPRGGKKGNLNNYAKTVSVYHRPKKPQLPSVQLAWSIMEGTGFISGDIKVKKLNPPIPEPVLD